MDETALKLVVSTPWLLTLCVWDVKHRRLPNLITLGGAAVCLVAYLGAGGFPLVLRGLLAGLLCGLFLFLPFLLRAAGGGDVKMLFACGILVSMGNIMNFLFFMSIAGFLLSLVMWVAGQADMSRVKHYVRSVFDWRYDRKLGREALPDRDNERCRIPFGVAIAVGVWATLIWKWAV
jgi:Flp pilus assembly protein protease CpaA